MVSLARLRLTGLSRPAILQNLPGFARPDRQSHSDFVVGFLLWSRRNRKRKRPNPNTSKDAVMGNKQLFAQIGVFALLGLNVGAYYVFWPHKESGAQSESKALPQAKAQTRLLPDKKDVLAPV